MKIERNGVAQNIEFSLDCSNFNEGDVILIKCRNEKNNFYDFTDKSLKRAKAEISTDKDGSMGNNKAKENTNDQIKIVVEAEIRNSKCTIKISELIPNNNEICGNKKTDLICLKDDKVKGRIQLDFVTLGLDLPIGTIHGFDGEFESDEWLRCDGVTKVDNVEYPELYELLGGKNGDPITTPNLKDKVLIGSMPNGVDLSKLNPFFKKATVENSKIVLKELFDKDIINTIINELDTEFKIEDYPSDYIDKNDETNRYEYDDDYYTKLEKQKIVSYDKELNKKVYYKSILFSFPFGKTDKLSNEYITDSLDNREERFKVINQAIANNKTIYAIIDFKEKDIYYSYNPIYSRYCKSYGQCKDLDKYLKKTGYRQKYDTDYSIGREKGKENAANYLAKNKYNFTKLNKYKYGFFYELKNYDNDDFEFRFFIKGISTAKKYLSEEDKCSGKFEDRISLDYDKYVKCKRDEDSTASKYDFYLEFEAKEEYNDLCNTIERLCKCHKKVNIEIEKQSKKIISIEDNVMSSVHSYGKARNQYFNWPSLRNQPILREFNQSLISTRYDIFRFIEFYSGEPIKIEELIRRLINFELGQTYYFKNKEYDYDFAQFYEGRIDAKFLERYRNCDGFIDGYLDALDERIKEINKDENDIAYQINIERYKSDVKYSFDYDSKYNDAKKMGEITILEGLDNILESEFILKDFNIGFVDGIKQEEKKENQSTSFHFGYDTGKLYKEKVNDGFLDGFLDGFNESYKNENIIVPQINLDKFNLDKIYRKEYYNDFIKGQQLAINNKDFNDRIDKVDPEYIPNDEFINPRKIDVDIERLTDDINDIYTATIRDSAIAKERESYRNKINQYKLGYKDAINDSEDKLGNKKSWYSAGFNEGKKHLEKRLNSDGFIDGYLSSYSKNYVRSHNENEWNMLKLATNDYISKKEKETIVQSKTVKYYIKGNSKDYSQIFIKAPVVGNLQLDDNKINDDHNKISIDGELNLLIDDTELFLAYNNLHANTETNQLDFDDKNWIPFTNLNLIYKDQYLSRYLSKYHEGDNFVRINCAKFYNEADFIISKSENSILLHDKFRIYIKPSDANYKGDCITNNVVSLPNQRLNVFDNEKLVSSNLSYFSLNNNSDTFNFINQIERKIPHYLIDSTNVPIGTIIPFINHQVIQNKEVNNTPKGWLACDGKEINEKIYKDLVELIGSRTPALIAKNIVNGYTSKSNLSDNQSKYKTYVIGDIVKNDIDVNEKIRSYFQPVLYIIKANH
ncbi:tail fiber protein [Chryseobacterium sp. Ch-15]|uniref:Tail fiber protein n=1 Tax=Chryseobacterium muglaense TaxID=2893752 RepID=A0A9Q3UST0_9FLAO|nr:phage tail protein [Chryseobacterium muglaense]MBD3907269.1 tail fiber protein [Chryseobacterium muglaense]MCC9033026.1 tail fiber protein [Chryseobacterium muglaense]MCM2556984.1 tail fiber protein [Chryseobacterium muglaense]